MERTRRRLRWDDVPEAVRDEVERVIGSAVVEAASQSGGYGPGLASRCLLADGRRAFIKAVSDEQNPFTPVMLRDEAVTAAALPPGAPAPTLRHVVDDGSWIALVYDEVPGRHPVLPWVDDDLRLVLQATLALGDVAPPPAVPTIAERFGPAFHGWRSLTAGPPPPIDPWARRHLDRLAALEATWEEAAAGDHLVHGDVRSDNVLLVGDDVVFVDWASTCTGARWFDAVAMLPSIELEGGGPPERGLALVGCHPPAAALTAVVGGLAGYFVAAGLQPDPPGLPTLRAFQRAQGATTVAWLRRLTGWP